MSSARHEIDSLSSTFSQNPPSRADQRIHPKIKTPKSPKISEATSPKERGVRSGSFLQDKGITLDYPSRLDEKEPYDAPPFEVFRGTARSKRVKIVLSSEKERSPHDFYTSKD